MTTAAKAELVIVDGKVRTPAHPSGFAQAAAIGGGTVLAVGTDDEIREFTGPQTRVVNLRGRLALPAFGDAHVHPVQGGFESLRCNLVGLEGRQDYLEKVAAYSDALPPSAWILGGGWSMPAFPGGRPTATDLDAVTGGRPAFLMNRDHHTAWVNTAALRIAGITERTGDPREGRIERDHAGLPTGALHDGAARLVADFIPRPSQAELTAALLAAQQHLHSLGITSIQDACVGDAAEIGMLDSFSTYQRAAVDRLLTLRVTGALWWDRFRGLRQLDDLQTRREAADRDGHFRATSVKLMLDGVCETFTAAMGTPYLDGHGHESGNHGNLFIEPGELAEATASLADLGFQMHFHAIGDRAVSAALDALANIPAAQRAAGRHHIAHLQFISPRDRQRFAQLGVVANFQPLWACQDEQNDQLTVPFVGPERAAWQYRIGSLARLGARVAFGSDWPVSSADPLQEMHVAVNRMLSTRLGVPGSPETTTPLLPDEAITVDAAVDAFTRGVAYVNRTDDVAGTLEPGKLADVAVLDQDIFAIPGDAIGSASVALTIASGRVVHGELPGTDPRVNTLALPVTFLSACAVLETVYNAPPSPGSQDPDDLAVLAGLKVVDDDDDDPVLLWPDGTPVDTWREEYPYDEKMHRDYYEHAKRRLQIELVKLQNWVKDTGQRIVIVFEGRDAAGKGGTIKRFTEHLNPRGATVVALEKPTERERTQWYFQRYVTHLPGAGEIVMFDRSWYNRAGVERVMGFCTPEEYLEFMREAPEFERMLVHSGLQLTKFWFSVSRLEQRTRFVIRQVDPVRQWKLSPMDIESLDKWDDYTQAKEAMFFYTDTADAPWTVVRSNDKKRARLEAMRHILEQFDYDGKDKEIVGKPDRKIIGPPADLSEKASIQSFTRLLLRRLP